jgi:hypothetical protein
MSELMTNFLKFVKEITNSIKKGSKCNTRRNLMTNLKFTRKSLVNILFLVCLSPFSFFNFDFDLISFFKKKKNTPAHSFEIEKKR